MELLLTSLLSHYEKNAGIPRVEIHNIYRSCFVGYPPMHIPVTTPIQFKTCGKNVTIYPWAKIVQTEVIEIGNNSRIDDFTLIAGGKGIKMGKYVHIASFVSIIGSGELVIGDYVGIAAGARIITGTDHYKDGARMTACLPKEQRNPIWGKTVIEKDAFIGTNCVIHPNVTIGEGAIIGSNSLVLHNVEPWTINVGSPCKAIGMRPKVNRGEVD